MKSYILYMYNNLLILYTAWTLYLQLDGLGITDLIGYSKNNKR